MNEMNKQKMIFFGEINRSFVSEQNFRIMNYNIFLKITKFKYIYIYIYIYNFIINWDNLNAY